MATEHHHARSYFLSGLVWPTKCQQSTSACDSMCDLSVDASGAVCEHKDTVDLVVEYVAGRDSLFIADVLSQGTV